MPHGALWSRISSTLPSAPAETARSMKLSGSSTKTSTRTVRVPIAVGVSQPLSAGSPRKKRAPSTVNPTTPPRFHNSVAPSARAYQCAAAVASGTASITEITGPWVSDVMVCFLLFPTDSDPGLPVNVRMVQASRSMLRAALLDVGGTLWPDRWPATAWSRAVGQRLRERFGLSPVQVERLLREFELRDPGPSSPPLLTQDSDAAIGTALRTAGLSRLLPGDVLVAMDVPSAGLIQPFVGPRPA